SVGCDFRKAQAAIAEQLAGALQPQPHHVMMRRDAHGAHEHTAEVEGAEAGDPGERVNFDRPVQVGLSEVANADCTCADKTPRMPIADDVWRNRKALMKLAATSFQ